MLKIIRYFHILYFGITNTFMLVKVCYKNLSNELYNTCVKKSYRSFQGITQEKCYYSDCYDKKKAIGHLTIRITRTL